MYLVFRPSFRALERIFLFFLAVLSVSFLGCAIWVGFDPGDVARGLVRMEMPGRQGALRALARGARDDWGGRRLADEPRLSVFSRAKGWRGPQYRRVQLYDFILGIAAMLVLNLAVWVLGAELLYPDRHIEHLEDLPDLLSNVLGDIGPAAVLRGDLLGDLHLDHRPRGRPRLARHACLAADAGGNRPDHTDFRRHPCYRWIAIGCLVPPLIWTMPGMPGFVALTLAANSAQVVLLPMLAGGPLVDHGERAPDRPDFAIAGGKTR